MINFTNKSSFNNLCKVILIDNIEFLNTNSVNALLKIIEEPNNNIFFFLIHDNKKQILEKKANRQLQKIGRQYDNKLNLLLQPIKFI